ncbi:LysR family transcriptional regulator [Agromyces archimandritae]|uniref:LysR family transcriptional regulator n=1 Tax=Agromyces archimandritae TaxID=2781962 RepID=A0A975FLW8_9MICO|nr:LysR family transcriptional regulator [Agromyces archimandritae]QTX04525.1 LysR family transcriptional regulator [Agromyces archimandritae]
MFTIDQLRCFVAVAEELHFGRAAERLRMTQPPLSRQIRRLEEILGVVLLERDNRRVEVTPAGYAFLREARTILATAERAPVVVREVAAGSSGVLRIGFTAASAHNVLGPLVTLLDDELPRVRVELEELVTSRQMEGLADGTLDLGIARPPFDLERFDSRLLFTETLMLAVPSGHPFTDSPHPPTVEQLGREPFIMPSATKARYFHDLAVRILPLDHDRTAHTVSQIATILALVAARRGISFVPESAIAMGVHGVELLPLGGLARDPVELHAVWSRTNASPALRRALELVAARSDAL